MTLVLTILQLLSAVAVTVIVFTQSVKRSGLSKATKWVGLVFVMLTLALHFV